jgi:hypothetical protein
MNPGDIITLKDDDTTILSVRPRTFFKVIELYADSGDEFGRYVKVKGAIKAQVLGVAGMGNHFLNPEKYRLATDVELAGIVLDRINS